MEILDRVKAVYRRKQQAEREWHAVVRELDQTPDAVPGAKPGHVAETYLRHALHRPHPAAEVRTAHALADDLPQMDDALEAGEISIEHVHAAVRTLRRIPAHLRAENTATIDAWFTKASRDLAPLDTDRAARGILNVLDPDGANTFDPNAVDRRELSITTDATGMVLVRGQLDPANGAAFKAAIDHYSAPIPAGDGELAIPDTRT